MVKVTLKDGSVREYEDNVTLLEVAKSLSQKLGKQALLAVVDGQNKDLSDKLTHDASVEFVVPESEEGLARYPPYCGACNGTGYSAPVPGCKICHWPCHCQRILLRP